MDLVERTERQPAAGQGRVEPCDAEGHGGDDFGPGAMPRAKPDRVRQPAKLGQVGAAGERRGGMGYGFEG
ncbi:hypothetical protein GCM10025880_23790 [Methylorubrum aminovorans]|nr:hypothetical protein GCM10025880_23790 [Methylorubrum aminovorans]